MPITDHRPAAPKELTAEQAEEWRAIVGRLPREWITREVQPLLVAYLQHWSTCRFLSKQIDAFNPDWIADPGGFERYSSWLALRARETKAMADLATKLRLTNQSPLFSEFGGTAGAAGAVRSHRGRRADQAGPLAEAPLMKATVEVRGIEE